MFIIRKVEVFEIIRKRIHPRFLSLRKNQQIYTCIYYHIKENLMEKVHKHFLSSKDNTSNDRSTEPHYHTKESLIKKVLKHFLSQSKDNASFKTSNQTYHRTKKISKKKTFETFLKLFKEQRFQVFRL